MPIWHWPLSFGICNPEVLTVRINNPADNDRAGLFILTRICPAKQKITGKKNGKCVTFVVFFIILHPASGVKLKTDIGG
jgi:hypothetical protein